MQPGSNSLNLSRKVRTWRAVDVLLPLLMTISVFLSSTRVVQAIEWEDYIVKGRGILSSGSFVMLGKLHNYTDALRACARAPLLNGTGVLTPVAHFYKAIHTMIELELDSAERVFAQYVAVSTNHWQVWDRDPMRVEPMGMVSNCQRPYLHQTFKALHTGHQSILESQGL